MHITICGYTTTPPLLCALQVFGADRIMFSSDYPFGDPGGAFRFLAKAPISPADRDKIAHRNAQNCFGSEHSVRDGRKTPLSTAEIDPESGCRIALIRREELDADGQKAFDFYTSRPCADSMALPGSGCAAQNWLTLGLWAPT